MQMKSPVGHLLRCRISPAENCILSSIVFLKGLQSLELIPFSAQNQDVGLMWSDWTQSFPVNHSAWPLLRSFKSVIKLSNVLSAYSIASSSEPK